MKAIVKDKPGEGFILTDRPEPQIKQSTEVKLKMIYSGICGTDVHINQWDQWSKENINLPHINGHEGLGKIVAVGDKVTKVKPGDYVSFETHIYDNTCRICKMNGYRVCRNMDILGVSVSGVWREYVVMPENIIFKLDGTVPLKYCAILEPFGNAYHTQSVSKIEGKNVLITGDGPIAIFAALIVQTRNPKHLFITGINEFRKNIIRKCGLNLIDPMQTDLKAKIMKETNNEGIDVVLEFTGNTKVLDSIVDIISELGDINILSIYPQQEIMVRLNELTFKNVRIQTILGRKIWSTWNEGYNLIKSKKIAWEHIDNVITHTIPFEQFKKGFELLSKHEASKILMTFGEAEK